MGEDVEAGPLGGCEEWAKSVDGEGAVGADEAAFGNVGGHARLYHNVLGVPGFEEAGCIGAVLCTEEG